MAVLVITRRELEQVIARYRLIDSIGVAITLVFLLSLLGAYVLSIILPEINIPWTTLSLVSLTMSGIGLCLVLYAGPFTKKAKLADFLCREFSRKRRPIRVVVAKSPRKEYVGVLVGDVMCSIDRIGRGEITLSLHKLRETDSRYLKEYAARYRGVKKLGRLNFIKKVVLASKATALIYSDDGRDKRYVLKMVNLRSAKDLKKLLQTSFLYITKSSA